ncbi:MAG TPA: GYF domain-containing protein [Polyangiaceae bacterium]
MPQHQPFVEEDEQTRVSDSVGALAGAFSHAVAAPEAGSLTEFTGSADEWYVGINGVPVGPIRLSELRSKASVGAITLDSLVWREGFEDWQALRTFPELVAIVEESVSSARASLHPLSSPSATGALMGTPGTAPAASAVRDPFALPAAGPGAAGFPGMAGMGMAGAAAPLTSPAVVTEKADDLDVAGLRRRGGGSPAAWIAVAVALLFGLTIGFVLFSRQTPSEPVVKYVEVPAKTPAAEPTAAQNEPETIEEATVAGSSKTGKGGTAVAKTTEKEPETGKPLTGLSGLSGLKGGPKSGPGSETAGGSAGQPLDSGTIQRTVSRYTGSVKRSCWQPALDTRSRDAPTSARVNVTITVGASGGVQSVSTSGEPSGYRGLAGCIAGRVRGWQFPASSGTTTVNVPFVFAAQ